MGILSAALGGGRRNCRAVARLVGWRAPVREGGQATLGGAVSSPWRRRWKACRSPGPGTRCHLSPPPLVARRRWLNSRQDCSLATTTTTTATVAVVVSEHSASEAVGRVVITVGKHNHWNAVLRTKNSERRRQRSPCPSARNDFLVKRFYGDRHHVVACRVARTVVDVTVEWQSPTVEPCH